MTRSANGRRLLRGGGAVRHGVALGLTLAVNGALILFLVVWRQRGRGAAAGCVRAVPIRVVESELALPGPAEAEPTEAVLPTEPTGPPPLPVPPMPDWGASDARLDSPPPLDLPIPPARRADMPLYTQGAVEPAAGTRGLFDVRPAAPLARPAGQPMAKPGASRGPVAIKPPNLSDYYPHRARLRGITGTTRIRLTIDTRGRVTFVEVLASTPAGVFETAARRVGRSLRFQPALRNNRPVAATVLLNLLWRLE